MANEVTLTTKLTWRKDADVMTASSTKKYDQTGNVAIENVQTIGAASETVFFGDVTDPGWLMFKNIGSNTVHLGTTTPATAANCSVHLVKGASHIVPNSQKAVWYAIADAQTDVNVIAIQR